MLFQDVASCTLPACNEFISITDPILETKENIPYYLYKSDGTLRFLYNEEQIVYKAAWSGGGQITTKVLPKQFIVKFLLNKQN